MAEEVDRVGERKGSGDTTTVDVQTLVEVFLNMSLKTDYFNEKSFFLLNSKISSLKTTLLKCQIIRISK
jgi:hypothetical protein